MNPDIIVDAVSISEAARLTGRSASWIRAKRNFGPLEPTTVEGLQGVTRRSLAHLMESIRSQQIAKAKQRTKLRLVIDNTR